MSAVELTAAIRSRQVSSHEVIQAHLRRIEEVNPSINTVVIVTGDQPNTPQRGRRAPAAAGLLARTHSTNPGTDLTSSSDARKWFVSSHRRARLRGGAIGCADGGFSNRDGSQRYEPVLPAQA